MGYINDASEKVKPPINVKEEAAKLLTRMGIIRQEPAGLADTVRPKNPMPEVGPYIPDGGDHEKKGPYRPTPGDKMKKLPLQSPLPPKERPLYEQPK